MKQAKYLSLFIVIILIVAKIDIIESKGLRNNNLKENFQHQQSSNINYSQSFLKMKNSSTKNEQSFLKKSKMRSHIQILSFLKKKNIDDSEVIRNNKRGVNYQNKQEDNSSQQVDEHNGSNDNHYYQMTLDDNNNFFVSNSLNSKSKNKDEFKEKNRLLIAEVQYLKDIEKDGWHKLYLNTFGDEEGISSSALQCFAGGFLEGYVSWKQIDEYRNNISAFFEDVGQNGLNQVKKLLEKIYNSLIERISKNDSETEILNEKKALIFCMVSQLEGLFKGYNQAIWNTDYSDEKKSNLSMTIIDFLLLNSEGNFSDLKKVAEYFEKGHEQDGDSDFSTKENLLKVFSTNDIIKIWKNLVKSSHCSVVLKLLNIDGKYDIIAGHDTWSKYAELVRTLKSYSYEFDSKVLDKENAILKKKREIVFSSYPGVMYSGDDFYIIDKKTVLLQTTLNVLNTHIYRNSIDINTYVPEFIRIMTTNLLSNDAESWISNFKDYEGHLYVTQWIVIDYENLNNLNINGEKPEKIVYLLDDVPGKINSKDMTNELFSETFLGSFNYPYFKETFETLGYSKFEYFKRENDIEINPRKHILNHLNSNIKDLDSFEYVISYNGFKSKRKDDKTESILEANNEYDLSLHDPSNGIMSRYDILESPYEKENYGGIDYKFVNSELVKANKFKARSGPTYNDNIEPFQHDGSNKYLKGVPHTMKFKTIIFNE